MTGIRVFFCFILVLSTRQLAADWQSTLLPVDDDIRQPLSDIRIQLPADVTIDVLRSLSLEINTIDVSRVVRVEESSIGFVVVVTPPQALAAGSHRIRLVEYSADGTAIERGEWTIQTGGPSDGLARSFDTNTTLSLGYRVQHDEVRDDEATDEDLTDDENWRGDGSMLLAGSLANTNNQFNAEASVLLSSAGVGLNQDPDDPRSGSDVDLGEYLLSWRRQHSGIQLGHHAIDYKGLIMDDFYRRGASADASSGNGKLNGTAFAFRTEPMIGRRDILGMEDEDARVVGGVISLNPLANQRALTVSLAGLTGKGKDESGLSLSGRDIVADGSAVSVAAESRLAADKVRLRGEYASTDYDVDSADGEASGIDDDAKLLLAEYSPFLGKALGGKPADLSFGAEYRQTGLFYHSIAYAFQPADKNVQRLYGNFRRGGLYLALSGGEERDNVDDNPELPTLETDHQQFSISWSPLPRRDDDGNPVQRWYGNPAITASLQNARQQQTDLPPDFEQDLIDRHTQQANLTASFQYPLWNWFVAYGIGDEDNRGSGTQDIENEIVSAGINFSVYQRTYLNLQYQYNRIEQSGGIINRNTLWNFGLDTILLPDRLSARINYSLNLDRATDDSFFEDNSVYNIEVNWQLVQARFNRPGLSIWLRGDFQDLDDRVETGRTGTPSQVFVGVSVDWASSLNRGRDDD